MTVNKTLRALWYPNMRVSDAALLSTTKPKKSSLRPTSNKTAETTTTKETVLRKKREPLEEISIPHTATEETEPIADFFREHCFLGAFSEDLEDMLTLKRAKPIYDSDDEDESPTKRSRTMAEEERDEIAQAHRPSSQALDFRDRLLEDEVEGFLLPHSIQ